jgi:ferritin-like metal-binding protein YciE
MSKVSTLTELYVEELKDLRSANDQMMKALKKITPKATNENLKSMLTRAPDGIQEHTEMLKVLIDAQNGGSSKEHCKGMEGLCTEAIKHTIEDAPKSGPVLDAAIIAQYQRMTHYGITGFGTAAAFAKALKLDSDATTLSSAVEAMYNADELMSELAEEAVNAEAVDG